MSTIEQLSPLARRAPDSGIVSVVDHGRHREGLIPLWVGEGDAPTPDFIQEAAIAALRGGETFYPWPRGTPALRQALADYHQRHFGHDGGPEDFFVTGSGMQSIRIAIEAVAAPGSEIVYFSPAWPNFPAALAITGSRPVPVLLEFGEDGWRLDLNRVEAAIGPKTRALFVNSPSNPTGWTASREDLSALMQMARRHGLWIIADEIYARFVYEGRRAASFFDVMQEGDRVVFANSFSKNWAMTGWRVGWICAPAELGQVIENLIQYSTSGVAPFLQAGAAAALREGDAFVDQQVDRAAKAREAFCGALEDCGRVRIARPAGSFYAFFAIDGASDSRRTAIDIVDAAAIGLAPGTAFGPGGEAFMRACFLRRLGDLETAAQRIVDYVERNDRSAAASF